MATAKKAKPENPLRRPLITPEGVDLRLELAEASERAMAFALDGLIMIATLVVLTLATLAAAFVGRTRPDEMVMIVWLLIFFVLRNGYFIGFELRGGGATPGKRVLGLRVATRNGGRLTADAIVARNIMRELEFFLPLMFLVAGPREQVDAWIILAGIVWSGVFLLFPLFNRDRLRVGDLVAGTWVIKAPKHRLAPDLAQDGPAAAFAFTPAQVDAYGVMELQVLEDVLRRSDRSTVSAVAERIRRKIEWTATADESDRAFLDAYYTALRKRLEQRLLFGKRRRDKHDKG